MCWIDRCAFSKMWHLPKIQNKGFGKVQTVLSPRLELGISRVSGGRINQLSHESAFVFQIATVGTTMQRYMAALSRWSRATLCENCMFCSSFASFVHALSMECIEQRDTTPERAREIWPLFFVHGPDRIYGRSPQEKIQELIFVLFISTHLVTARPEPTC